MAVMGTHYKGIVSGARPIVNRAFHGEHCGFHRGQSVAVMGGYMV